MRWLPHGDTPWPQSGRPGGAIHPCVAVQVAVEFLVPPVSVEFFRMGLDLQLSERSVAYAQGRRTGQLAAPLIWTVPSGTFHQWRVAWRHSDQEQRSARWSPHDQWVQSILQQARVGWRDALEA